MILNTRPILLAWTNALPTDMGDFFRLLWSLWIYFASQQTSCIAARKHVQFAKLVKSTFSGAKHMTVPKVKPRQQFAGKYLHNLNFRSSFLAVPTRNHAVYTEQKAVGMPFTKIYANSRFQPETHFFYYFPTSPAKPGLLVFSREIKVKVLRRGSLFYCDGAQPVDLELVLELRQMSQVAAASRCREK